MEWIAILRKNVHIPVRYTVWKVISSDWWCQNVPLSIIYMFVLDHKEKGSLINHKIVCLSECFVINCVTWWRSWRSGEEWCKRSWAQDLNSPHKFYHKTCPQIMPESELKIPTLSAINTWKSAKLITEKIMFDWMKVIFYI